MIRYQSQEGTNGPFHKKKDDNGSKTSRAYKHKTRLCNEGEVPFTESYHL